VTANRDPDTDQLPPPGEAESVTAKMAAQPDHGEDTYRGSGRLEGLATVITGGDSGIGRAVAIAFAREGANVLLSYLPAEQQDAEATAGLVEAAGRRSVLVPGDLTAEATCQEVVDRAVQEFGRIDVLVNNAAYQMAQPGGIADISSEQFDRVMRTNLYATFWLCKKALPHMRRGASIINTSSVVATSPSPQLLDYALSKEGIRVNSVAPGPVWTPLIPATMPEEMVEEFGLNTPMKRPGQPVEIASAYVFLASAESSYITGEIIGVTGGM
jgi:NAD(P)-dependent dehydrogenase (short-subunit alcohol dehydrogenase family)